MNWCACRWPSNPSALAQLKQDKGFGFDLRLVTVDEADMDEDQSRRVSEGDTVMALGKEGDSIRVFAGMVGTPWVLEIGPLYQMNPYPPEWLVLIAALGLTLIGLIVYLLVRQLERRLRGLEAAATRIAKGSLETRVPARGADSVGRLASAFNGMAEHLQQLLAIQRELVRAVSHELRTPVARLRFGLEMIGSATTPQALEKYCEGMDHDIEDLDRLVDEMLDLRKARAGLAGAELPAHRPGCAGQSGDRGAGAFACRRHGAARIVPVGGRLRRCLGRG